MVIKKLSYYLAILVLAGCADGNYSTSSSLDKTMEGEYQQIVYGCQNKAKTQKSKYESTYAKCMQVEELAFMKEWGVPEDYINASNNSRIYNVKLANKYERGEISRAEFEDAQDKKKAELSKSVAESSKLSANYGSSDNEFKAVLKDVKNSAKGDYSSEYTDNSDEKTCKSYGLKKGSRNYMDCMLRLKEGREQQAQQDRANYRQQRAEYEAARAQRRAAALGLASKLLSPTYYGNPNAVNCTSTAFGNMVNTNCR